LTGKFNDFAMRMANVMHRFQAGEEDVQAVYSLYSQGRIRPTVDVLSGAMPASASYDPIADTCTS
jgi:hypothetical protein